MSKLLKSVAVLALFVLLAGCGAKGPLVLPDRADPEEAPVEQPADDADDTSSDEAADDAVESVPAQPATND